MKTPYASHFTLPSLHGGHGLYILLGPLTEWQDKLTMYVCLNPKPETMARIPTENSTKRITVTSVNENDTDNNTSVKWKSIRSRPWLIFYTHTATAQYYIHNQKLRWELRVPENYKEMHNLVQKLLYTYIIWERLAAGMPPRKMQQHLNVCEWLHTKLLPAEYCQSRSLKYTSAANTPRHKVLFMVAAP